MVIGIDKFQFVELIADPCGNCADSCCTIFNLKKEAPTVPEGASDHINFARSIENRRNI